MNDQKFLAELLILSTVKRKGTVSSSYFFSQIFSVLGVDIPLIGLINNLTDQSLIIHEGRFEGTSGLIKNISLTERGIDFVTTHPIQDYTSHYKSSFGHSELLASLLGL